MQRENNEGRRVDGNVVSILQFFSILALSGLAGSYLKRKEKGENVDDQLTAVCDELTERGRGFYFTRCEPFGSIVHVSFGKVELNAPVEFVVAAAIFAAVAWLFAMNTRRSHAGAVA